MGDERLGAGLEWELLVGVVGEGVELGCINTAISQDHYVFSFKICGD